MKAKIYESGTLINGIKVIQDLGMYKLNPNNKKPQHYIKFQCPFCDNTFVCFLYSVKDGHTTSCGCYNKKHSKEIHTKHSLHSHPMYNSWCNIKNRCNNSNNPRYKDYGGRGISVCKEWENDFIYFYNDMKDTWKEGLSIERKDNDGNYCKDNCKWATTSEQNVNQRIRKDNSTGYIGIHFHKEKILNQWSATVCFNQKQIHIGYFPTALQAAIERDKYVKEHCLPNKLNFG